MDTPDSRPATTQRQIREAERIPRSWRVSRSREVCPRGGRHTGWALARLAVFVVLAELVLFLGACSLGRSTSVSSEPNAGQSSGPPTRATRAIPTTTPGAAPLAASVSDVISRHCAQMCAAESCTRQCTVRLGRLATGLASGGTAFCGATGPDRGECQALSALLRNDLGACATMPTTAWSGECVRWIAGLRVDRSLCSSIEDPRGKDNCLLDQAVAARSTAGCGGLSTATRSDICIRAVAASLKDETLCTTVSRPDRVGLCLTYVAVARADVRLCDRVEAPDHFGCLDFVAAERGDPSLCAAVPDGYERDTWRVTVADAVGDGATCPTVSDPVTCSRKVALAVGSPDPCFVLVDPSHLAQCLTTVAAAIGKESVCDSIDSADLRASCAAAARSGVIREPGSGP